MIEWRADLHCHTTASDGTETPAAIIDLALKCGLKALSITDHDTIAAYDEAVPHAKEKGLPLLPGLELSTLFQKESIHILVYGFSLRSEVIHNLVLSQKKRREERNLKILANLKALGMEIKEEELQKSTATGRPHIALAMMEKGFVGSVKQAFEKYLGEGKPAYDGGVRMEVHDAIKIVHDAGALAILAHPHLLNHKKVLKALVEMPFDGIECHYALMPKDREAPFLQIAKQKGWIATGGSDYHGQFKEHIPLGSSWTPQETFEKLYDHYLRNETAAG